MCKSTFHGTLLLPCLTQPKGIFERFQNNVGIEQIQNLSKALGRHLFVRSSKKRSKPSRTVSRYLGISLWFSCGMVQPEWRL